MSKLSNYIKSKQFGRDGLFFFIGYLIVSFAVGAPALFVVGSIGFIIFWFIFVSEMDGKK